MSEVNRGKGNFLQAGLYCIYPIVTGDQVANHDGTLAMDTVYNQADYPTLFGVLGTHYNSSAKGDDDESQFRTPPVPSWFNDSSCELRIRF